jgi:hypothetical protein
MSSVWSQPSNGKKELSPSSLFKRSSWYKMTLMGTQEKEDLRSTLLESRPLEKFPNSIALMSSIIDFESSSVQEAANQ